jgi:protein CpxP
VTKFATKIFLAGVMSLFLCIGVGAMAYQDQNAPPPPPREGHPGRHGHGGRPNAEQRLAHLSQQLNLTDDQKAKIKPILEDEDARTKALWEDTSTPREDKRAKFMSIHQATMDQVKSLLTDEQQKKLSDMRQRMQQHLKEGGGDRD